MPVINYDRGVMKMTHPTLKFDIYMYLDTPGVYINAHGVEVTEEAAKAAGFDVVTLGKKRRFQEQMKIAQAALSAELEMDPSDRKVVEERDGFALVQVSKDTFIVESPDGGALTPFPTSKSVARQVLDSIKRAAPAEVKEPAPEVSPSNPNDAVKGVEVASKSDVSKK